PAITWGSTAFYRLFHHEPVRTSADVLRGGSPDPRRDPYDSNQAIPTLIATRDRDRFHRLCPTLRIAGVQWFALAAYPLSGGFQPWGLIGEGVARRLIRIERAIEPALGRFAGFRMLLTVERAAARAAARGAECRGEPAAPEPLRRRIRPRVVRALTPVASAGRGRERGRWALRRLAGSRRGRGFVSPCRAEP